MVAFHLCITILLLVGVLAILACFVKVFIKEKKKDLFAWFSLVLVTIFCGLGAGSIWLSHEQVLATHRFYDVANNLIDVLNGSSIEN
jgi:hypothetical protein